MIIVKYETEQISLFELTARKLRIKSVIHPCFPTSQSAWYPCLIKSSSASSRGSAWFLIVQPWLPPLSLNPLQYKIISYSWRPPWVICAGHNRQGEARQLCWYSPVANWAFHGGMGRQLLHSHTLRAVNCSVQNPPGPPRARGSAALPSGKLNPSPMTSPPHPGGITSSQAQGPRGTSFLPSRSNSGLPWPGF